VAIAGLSLRIYLDHNVDPLLAKDARKAGYDAVAAVEVGNAALEDDEQLRWAASQRRCILTHDYDDYPRLATDWSTRAGTIPASSCADSRRTFCTARCCAVSLGCSIR
jgi:uncharacterized protein with PIN domain